MHLEIQGLTLWNSHWKVRKLVTEMARISWLNGSMATRPHCGTTERKRVKVRAATVDHAVFNSDEETLERMLCVIISFIIQLHFSAEGSGAVSVCSLFSAHALL